MSDPSYTAQPLFWYQTSNPTTLHFTTFDLLHSEDLVAPCRIVGWRQPAPYDKKPPPLELAFVAHVTALQSTLSGNRLRHWECTCDTLVTDSSRFNRTPTPPCEAWNTAIIEHTPPAKDRRGQVYTE